MKKRRGFTLSELLVVVVIIGVLSAVVLPKFSKVIETRKTTEAEELMSAVRTEQEARCTLSKKYTASTASLGSYRDGKNFDYSLGTVGMTASAKSGKYTLEMPSYADGRICCSSGCDSLNKSYPLCSELIHNTDYIAGNEDCGIEIEKEKETPTTPEEQECVSGTTDEKECSNNCGETGTQKNQCIGGKWQGWGACSVSDKTSCGGDEPNPTDGKCQDGDTKVVSENADAGGCSSMVAPCKDGEWDYSSITQVLKEGNECWTGQTKGIYSCVQCKWGCAPGKVEIDGVCCLPGQKVKNGKCLYKYRPNRFNTGVLVNCHDADMSVAEHGGYISEEEFNSGYMGYLYQYGTYEAYKAAVRKQYGGTQAYYAPGGGGMVKQHTCSAMNYAHYRGGKLPYVKEGSGCDWHHAYYNGGKWWEGGTRIKGDRVSSSTSDQDWCDSICGPKASCDTKGIISQDAPNTCSSYHCSNGWHCDNTEGTGVALECIRE